MRRHISVWLAKRGRIRVWVFSGGLAMSDPRSIEQLIQANGQWLVKNLLTLARSRNRLVALRATQELMERGYGGVKQSDRDPWDDVNDNGNVSRVMAQIFEKKESKETDDE